MIGEELRAESELTDEQRAAMEAILTATRRWLERAMAALETPEGTVMERFNQVSCLLSASDEGRYAAAEKAGVMPWVSGCYTKEVYPLAFVESVEWSVSS